MVLFGQLAILTGVISTAAAGGVLQTPLLSTQTKDCNCRNGSGSDGGWTRGDVVSALKEAAIIPEVIDDFRPTLLLNVTWHHKKSNHSAELGNNLKPKWTKHRPEVVLTAPSLPPKNSTKSIFLKDKLSKKDNTDVNIEKLYEIRNNLVFVITDPDAPSRILPDNSEFLHWIAVGIPVDLSNAEVVQGEEGAEEEASKKKKKHKHVNKHGWLQDLVSYHPPSPPALTGYHRYALLAYMPRNATSEPLNLRVPTQRKHWGYGQQRHGVRDWANEMGLLLIGANYFSAEHCLI